MTIGTRGAVLAVALLLAGISGPAGAQQPGDAAVKIGPKSIGGVVSSPAGREAGVWVIAETTELPTRFARIVVTDDQGRYLIPDLPQANYNVWARGYGLIDSPKRRGRPGQLLDLAAAPAPDAASAAHYYPAIYWYSLLEIPDKSQFGGENGIPAKATQQEWLSIVKNRACVGCHQLGQESTRTIPAAFANLGSRDAWVRRVQSGQSAPFMVNPLAGQLGGVPFKYFAEWTDRIAAGQLPREKPPRPQGVERNLVITEWDWSRPERYLHDSISTDKRYPTVNAGGKIFGSPEYATDELPILDPTTGAVTYYIAPVRDPAMPLSLGPGHAATEKPAMPSPYWGDRAIWDTRVNNHNMMLDKKGRVWLTASVRGRDNPPFCKEGSDHPSAKLFPLKESSRQLAMLDPATMKYTFVDTCFQTHHLQFGFDANDTLWTSGGGPVVGWLNTKLFDETGDAQKAQGWTAVVLDANGKRDAAVEPDQPVDPGKDKRITGGFYAVMPSPVDASIWGTVNAFGGKGAIVRLDPGKDPPATALAEIYHVPSPGFSPRGADIDKKGVVWVSLGSGHLGSFDRKKCKAPLSGPQATGDQCPEGWSFYQYPGPGFAGIGDNSAEASYYTWVDQHNTLGLGEDVPISTGNQNDALLALVDGKWVVIRVPYPLSFYAKGLDGRIDDPNAGWKGRGLWTTSGDRTPWLKEGGKGTVPIAYHFQLRPNPLAE
ncbi:MAG TPA: hypothetical protein VGQ90_08405 [Stellaceae bacterium]|jgi:hypothetical protein|nr:hypothetical protein [Stellaceae bacterium]